MRTVQLISALVVGFSAIAALGSLAVLVSNAPGAATFVVALLMVAIAGTSAVGARSRRWLANPYW